MCSLRSTKTKPDRRWISWKSTFSTGARLLDNYVPAAKAIEYINARPCLWCAFRLLITDARTSRAASAGTYYNNIIDVGCTERVSGLCRIIQVYRYGTYVSIEKTMWRRRVGTRRISRMCEYIPTVELDVYVFISSCLNVFQIRFRRNPQTARRVLPKFMEQFRNCF